MTAEVVLNLPVTKYQGAVKKQLLEPQWDQNKKRLRVVRHVMGVCQSTVLKMESIQFPGII